MKLPYPINRKQESITISILITNIIASFYFFYHFPSQVAIHWDIYGQADKWADKTFAAFFFPALIVAVYILMVFAPLLDPRKDRYQEFSKIYGIIRLTIILFLSALYFISSLNALGVITLIQQTVPLAIGLLFVIIGNFLPKIKNNWFVGIKTPWTLSSEEVWNKTHRLGGKVFVGGGLLLMVGVLLPSSTYLLLLPLVILSIVGITVGYSYFIWQKLKK